MENAVNGQTITVEDMQQAMFDRRERLYDVLRELPAAIAPQLVGRTAAEIQQRLECEIAWALERFARG